MIFALINGVLFGAPEQRTAKSGKPLVTATIKSQAGESLQWIRVSAFSESARAELMRLSDGDALAAQGPLKVELYQPEAREARVSLSIVADLVLALRQPPRPRATKKTEPDPRSRQERLSDEIPL